MFLPYTMHIPIMLKITYACMLAIAALAQVKPN